MSIKCCLESTVSMASRKGQDLVMYHSQEREGEGKGEEPNGE